MNWDKIKEKYPKGLTAWLSFRFGVDSLDDWGMTKDICISQIQVRTLYDFFDEQGIWIELTFEGEGKFHYDILKDARNYLHIGCDPYSESTRTEAEEKAFEKAFEILETKLKAA